MTKPVSTTKKRPPGFRHEALKLAERDEGLAILQKAAKSSG